MLKVTSLLSPGFGDVIVGVFVVFAGELGVVRCEPVKKIFFLVTDGSDDLAGDAHDDHAIGYDHVFFDQCACCDEASFADDGPAEEDGAHADE